MSNTEIEKRLADLEAEVASLKRKIEDKNGDQNEVPWWKKRMGVFANDPIYDEAMRLGGEYRESQQMVYDDEDED